MHDIATVSGDLKAYPWYPDVVVDRTGTATMAWTAWMGGRPIRPVVIRTADNPPAPGDPQDPTQGARVLSSEPEAGVHLGIDAAGVQTLVYAEEADKRKGDGVAWWLFDLVLFDRAPGGGWSKSPEQVVHRFLDRVEFAVNASGAAVVVWQQLEGPGEVGRMYASYRRAAGARWTAQERVPVADVFDFHVGIDDAGRVLLVYDRIADENGGVKAIRRTRTGGWGKLRNLSGPGTEVHSVAVGAGGAAVATHSKVDGDGRPVGQQFTSRMSTAGTWGAPVRQPKGLVFGRALGVDVDAKGRALVVGWNGQDVMGRWSRPGGRWRKPFVVAPDVSKPGVPLVEVNRRGDALVVWSTKGRVKQLWARYKPAGQAWTKLARVARADSPPQWFDAAIGDCGHAAIAWRTPTTRQIQVRRASPTP